MMKLVDVDYVLGLLDYIEDATMVYGTGVTRVGDEWVMRHRKCLCCGKLSLMDGPMQHTPGCQLTQLRGYIERAKENAS